MWSEEGPREGSITLDAEQPQPIELRFFQCGGTAFLKLYWSWEGHPKELIPASAFWHVQSDMEGVQRMMEGDIRARAKTDIKCEIYCPRTRLEDDDEQPLPIGPGPHLLLDDQLISGSHHIWRKVNVPVREFNGPIITGQKDKEDN